MSTSESVGYGHPDKAADQVSDALVDAILAQDPNARTAIEVLLKDSNVVLAGEIRTNASVDRGAIARDVLTKIYPTGGTLGSSAKPEFKVTDMIGDQSPEIAIGTDAGGAGDQGIVVGYATNVPDFSYLPEPYWHATKIAELIKEKAQKGIGSDVKTQVTIHDDQSNVLDLVLISCHSNYGNLKIREFLEVNVLRQYANENGLEIKNVLVNPSGSFLAGGPWADCGLTGRKTQVDSYGGLVTHGGGAFSGKDPSKVDRSGAYMARHAALWAVNHYGLVSARVRVAYAIGKPEPVEVIFDAPLHTPQTLIMDAQSALERPGLWSPKGIDERFGLRKFGKYQETAAYGHFTRPEFPWNKVVDEL